MPKWCKMLIAVLLLPACYGAAVALFRAVQASGAADTVWVALLAGAACWVVIYLLLPKPMWVYVFGHELTHAIWAWAFGGRVKKFKTSSRGGHVIVTKSNFLIALAPYFFPLYAIMVVAFFALGHWLWNWRAYTVWFHLLLGAAYAFHVTLTLHILQHTQTDITEQGWLFSAVVIFLGNAFILLAGFPFLGTGVDARTAVHWWWEASTEFFRWLAYRR